MVKSILSPFSFSISAHSRLLLSGQVQAEVDFFAAIKEARAREIRLAIPELEVKAPSPFNGSPPSSYSGVNFVVIFGCLIIVPDGEKHS
jgi:hypothetical protein